MYQRLLKVVSSGCVTCVRTDTTGPRTDDDDAASRLWKWTAIGPLLH
jgi:hypothetical protein